MTAGTMLLVWMGELITQYGVGQGVSIIIFGGIMSRLPFQVVQGFAAGIDFMARAWSSASWRIVTIVAIIYVYEGQRRIPVQISKQIRGNRVYGGGTTHIPLKVNSAGMIPLIFASSMLICPWTIVELLRRERERGRRARGAPVYDAFNAAPVWVYWVLYFVWSWRSRSSTRWSSSSSRTSPRTCSGRTALSRAFGRVAQRTSTCPRC